MKKRLKSIVALALAVSAVWALSASAAEAAVHWNVNGSPLGVGATEGITEKVELTKFGGETTPAVTMKLTVGGSLLSQIRCSVFNAKSGKVIGPASGSIGSYEFTACQVLNGAGGPTTCVVKSSGGVEGVLTTFPLKSQLKGGGSVAYDVFTPEGEKVATFSLAGKGGGSCSLAGTFTIKGSFAFRHPTGTNLQALEWESSQAIAMAAEVKMTISGLGGEASLNGRGNLRIASGKTWGVGL